MCGSRQALAWVIVLVVAVASYCGQTCTLPDTTPQTCPAHKTSDCCNHHKDKPESALLKHFTAGHFWFSSTPVLSPGAIALPLALPQLTLTRTFDFLASFQPSVLRI